MNLDNIYKYGKDITWSLPLLFEFEPCYSLVYEILKQNGINLPPVNIFGSYATLLWCGGRAKSSYHPTLKQVKYTFDYVKNFNGVPTLTFTNTLLNKADLNDKQCNQLLDLAMEYDAHIIVFSDMLKDYIKNKYPNAYIVASVIKPIFEFLDKNKKEKYCNTEEETRYYNNLIKEYDLVVVRPEYVVNTLLKNQNKITDLSKIEVLINHYCIINCPKAIVHYNSISNFFKNNEPPMYCLKQTTESEKINSKLSLTTDNIETLVKLGIRHLKIQGRGNQIPPSFFLNMICNKLFNTEGDFDYLFNFYISHQFPHEFTSFYKKLNSL